MSPELCETRSSIFGEQLRIFEIYNIFRTHDRVYLRIDMIKYIVYVPKNMLNENLHRRAAEYFKAKLSAIIGSRIVKLSNVYVDRKFT